MKICEVNIKKMHHPRGWGHRDRGGAPGGRKGYRQEIGYPASAFDPGRRVRGADKRLSTATYH